jgi:hypothetical protein
VGQFNWPLTSVARSFILAVLLYSLSCTKIKSSESPFTGGLKEALIQGSKTAIASLGTEGGYLDNPAVRISLPMQLQIVEKGLFERFVRTLADVSRGGLVRRPALLYRFIRLA